MDLTALVADIFGIVGFVVTGVGALFIARAIKESKTAQIWREEAEANRARSERLECELADVRELLKEKIRELSEVRERFVPLEDDLR